MDILKGNYKSPKLKNAPKEPEKKAEPGFEAKAAERLGGSIAFVMQSKTFLWTGDEKDSNDKK